MADSKPTVGFVGLGLMGGPMVENLLANGFAVTVFNRTAAKAEAVLEKGAVWADTPAGVAKASDVVLLCVMGTPSVDAVVFGPDGVAAGGRQGAVLVDHSTTDASPTREMAQRLRDEAGMGWVDAPVSGGPPAAGSGTLTVMAGGADADIARIKPVMDVVAGRFTHMGPVGTGQVTKMVNQIIVLTNFCVLAEAMKLAEAAGIDSARIPEALAGGFADGAMLQKNYPRMQKREFDPPQGFAHQVLKDLDMVLTLSHDLAAPVPMASQAANLYRILCSRGHGSLDGTAVFKLYDKDPV
jgi:3-hydroxyisobutyrate dehydrogenase